MNAAPDEILLDAVETRVVGALMEKETTTPDYYPLSLNALVNACNQASNRDPVTAYDEDTVRRALAALREKKLVYVFEGAANRVAKFGHKVGEVFGLSRPEMATLYVLLLRGPQTVGEIRGRSVRLHDFADLGGVETTLQALAVRQPRPLVTRLPRQIGFKESRYAHLLGGPPTVEAVRAAPLPVAVPTAGAIDRLDRLEAELAALRRELDEVKARLTGPARPDG